MCYGLEEGPYGVHDDNEGDDASAHRNDDSQVHRNLQRPNLDDVFAADNVRTLNITADLGRDGVAVFECAATLELMLEPVLFGLRFFIAMRFIRHGWKNFLL